MDYPCAKFGDVLSAVLLFLSCGQRDRQNHPHTDALCFSSSVIFLLVDACVGLNWLLVSFLSHVNKNIIHSFRCLTHATTVGVIMSKIRYILI